MVNYGYLRVSTGTQNIENNKNWILRKANELKIGNVEFVEETITGKKDWRKRKLGELYEKAIKGDKIITFEASRLGRDFKQNMEFLACCDRKGIQVICGDLDDNLNSMSSNLQMFINAMSAERERLNTSRRTKEALQKKKEEGVILGRRKGIMMLDKDEKNKEDIQQLLNDGVKLYIISKKYDITPLTLSRYIQKHNLQKIKNTKE